MEGEASYYLGLAHLAAEEYETALTVSWSKLVIIATFSFYFIVFSLFYYMLLQTQQKCMDLYVFRETKAE